jgi:MFS family permease
LWIGETTSTLGTRINTVVLPLVAVSTLHASAFTVSAVTAAAWLPWLLIGLLAGPFVDRHKRRRMMITCDLIAAGLFATIPIAAALGLLSAAQLLGVAFAAGCVSVLFTTAYAVFLIDLVTDVDDRAKANSTLQASASAAQVAGPGMAGLLAQIFGVVTAVIANSLSFLVSAICLAGVRTAERPCQDDASAQSLRRTVSEGVSFLRHDRLLRPLVLFGGMANLCLIGYQALLVVFLVRTVGLNAGTVGVLLALVSCGGLLGAVIANPVARKLGSGRALLLTKVGACPFALLIPLTAPGPRICCVVLGGLGVGIGIVAGNVISSSFMQAYTPPELYARSNATTNVFNCGTMPIGALLAGALATAFGVRDALWIMTGMLPATTMLLVTSPLRRLRSLPAASARPAVAADDSV